MNKLFLIFSFLGSMTCLSQTITSNQFALNILAPSLEYEISVSRNSTIDLNIGVGFAYHRSSYRGEAYGFYPGFEIQYRYFYNFVQREDKGNKTSQNSANYIAAVASVTGGHPIIGNLEYPNDYGAFIGPAWGLQRVYDNNFKLNINLGAGIGFNDSGDIYFTPLFGLQLGWLVAP